MAIDPSTAFVSYSREDREFVLRLAKDLKAKGAKVWMDTLDIRPGQTWADEIEAAVTSCSRMLIVLSPASVASRNVQAEVGYAISEGKEIIPIFYRQCTIPFRLLPFQYADFRARLLRWVGGIAFEFEWRAAREREAGRSDRGACRYRRGS